MRLTIEGEHLLLTQLTPLEQNKARAIQCRSWDRGHRGWTFPIRADVIKELEATLGVTVPPEAKSQARETESREAGVREAKLQGWENVRVTEPMPLKQGIVPFEHQKLAYEISCNLLGVFF